MFDLFTPGGIGRRVPLVLQARAFFLIMLALIWTLLAVPRPAEAQTYPVNSPSYIPTAVLAPATCSAACDIVFNVNGVNSVLVRVAGSGTGIAAVAQVSSDRIASPNWSNVNVHAVGGVSQSAMAATGLYRINTAGAAQLRIHLTAVTGSITIGASGSPGSGIVISSPDRKATYSAVAVGLAPAASATDFLTVTGSASATVRILEAQCSGVSTAAATATVVGLVRSTANSAGTASTLTNVPLDSNSVAATAVAKSYTANPTTGTLVGNIRVASLTTGTAASSAVTPTLLSWRFGNSSDQEVVLRGTSQVFALNGNAASFSAGTALNCSVTWTEE